VIRARYSCRNYTDRPIEAETQARLETLIATLPPAPFGAPVRFALVAASSEDRSALRGLGTYGFIRGATAFILGAVGEGERNLEDFGYLMECVILYATALGLGTCWLGGTFTKSRFARRLELAEGETMPAVAAAGYPADERHAVEVVTRRSVGADRRRPWEALFFWQRFGLPLSREMAGAYAEPLEMVRMGPSASNKQPWRVVRGEGAWHFYVQRSRGYTHALPFRLLGIADMQRIDVGIAMAHFALAAGEQGLAGHWQVRDPGIACPDDMTHYRVSWIER
jgi:nitroreductase